MAQPSVFLLLRTLFVDQVYLLLPYLRRTHFYLGNYYLFPYGVFVVFLGEYRVNLGEYEKNGILNLFCTHFLENLCIWRTMTKILKIAINQK